ncbi:hexose transporter protein [Colletotrichum tofieldiae]|nr:hexose transporter protein [Colletotrichum tofieldiae]
MGFLKGLSQKKPKSEAVIQAQEEAPDFEKVNWIKDPGLRKLYFYAFVLCIASATTGYDGMFFNSVQNFDSWQEFFDHPKGGQLGLLSAFYQIGSLVSIPMVPWVADNFGRKIPIVLGCVIMVAGAVLQGACQNLGNRLPMLLAELCHPQHRARLTTVYNCLWNVGALVVAWLSFGTDFLGNEWSWRVPAIGQAVPSVIQLLFIFWVPESPRYLIAKDRHEEALQILGKYHANGNTNHPTVQFEFREIRETIKREIAAKNSSSYLDFFRTPGNKYRFVVLISLGLFSQWSGNAIISNYTNILYTNAGIESSTARLGLSAGQTGLSLIVSLTLAMQVDRFGRRPIFLASTGGMLMTFVFWTLSAGLYEEHGSPGSNYAMIFFIWLFGFFYAFAWSGLLISYSIEILPYKLRAKGLMIVNLTVQAALTLNNYANPYAFEHFEGHTWKLYLIYTSWIFLELTFVYFFYVETKGPTLEELVKVIDGPDAEVADLDLAQVEQEVKIGHEAEEFEHKRG